MHPCLRAALVLLIVLSACSVDVDDFAGRRCDEERGCLDQRVCVDGRCVARLADGGAPSSDGGALDGGVPEPDAGVTWRQATNGFDRTRELNGTANIAAAAENRLEVQVGSNPCQAVGVEESQFPPSASGAFAGRIQLSSAPSGALTVVYVESERGGALVRLSVDSDGALICESSAGTLQPTALSVRSGAGAIAAGTVHTVEAAFLQGVSLKVWVDDALVCDAPLGAFTDVSARTKELRVGLDSYAGTTAVSATLTGWRYAENALVRLKP